MAIQIMLRKRSHNVSLLTCFSKSFGSSSSSDIDHQHCDPCLLTRPLICSTIALKQQCQYYHFKTAHLQISANYHQNLETVLLEV